MDRIHDGEPSRDDVDDHRHHHHHLDNFEKSQPLSDYGAIPGKIFIGGLARETTTAQFVKYFGQYGEIIDSVIMKDRKTGHPRGFGFVTYADPSVVDRVIEETHIINGKQVEIKRTIPKGASGSKDLKTKKIFVGGIPTNVNDDDFKEFFSQFGEVKEHQIMKDHSTNRSRGFGFITFESELVVDDLLSKGGNRIDLAGAQVEIKKAEPKRLNPPPAPAKRYSDSRNSYGDGFDDSYGGYRSVGAYGGRASGYGGYGEGEYGGFGGYGVGSGVGPYRGDPSMAYSGRYGGGYGGGMNRGYDFGGGNYGGPGEGYGYGGGGGYGYGGGDGYGGSGGYSRGGYDAGYGAGGSSGAGSSFYSGRGGYGGSGRYHPYGR